METKLSKASWMDRFGNRLMQLQPSMNAVTAAANAVDAYPDSAAVEPEEAASSFLEECGPDKCLGSE